jgi:hypothetical protein
MGRLAAISLLTCALALAIAACGSSSDGTIPRDEGEHMLQLLSETEDAVAEGECALATEYAQEFVLNVEDLPQSVDPEVVDELAKAGANLVDQTNDDDQCTEGATGETGSTEDTSTTSTTEAETTTTEAETTTTEETTTVEEPEEQPEEEPDPPAGGGNEGGGPEPGGGNPGGGGGPPDTEGGGVSPTGGVSGKR